MSLLDYLGRFHPVLVHLPIGILLSAIFLECLTPFRGFKKVRRSVRILLLLGFASSFFASTTGWLHALSGDFDADLVASHRALALVVTAFSFLALILHGRKGKEVRVGYFIVLFSLTILLLLTGHSGGSITHGVDFLRPPVAEWWGFGSNEKVEVSLRPESRVYADLVAPVLKKKCTGCHGPSRQKGKLRLDRPEFIEKGGEDGAIVDKGNPETGELWRRISLERGDEDHMPPKEKTPLSASEYQLITYWLKNGADFHTTLGALPQSDSLILALGSQTSMEAEEETPMEPVPMPDPALILELQQAGITVSFLAQGDGRLLLQCMNADRSKLPALLTRLKEIDVQLMALSMPQIELSHEDWKFLSSLTRLKRLHLERSNFDDEDLRALTPLNELDYLNLVGTPVTGAGFARITLTNLKQLFLYQSAVKADELAALKKQFPGAVVELGGYFVSTLHSDTTEQKDRYVVPK